MTTVQKPPSLDEAIFPTTQEAAADVCAWQTQKIKAGLKDADEGRFASADEMKATIQTFIQNG